MRIFEAYDMLSIEGVMRPGDVYMEIGAHKGRFLEASGLLRTDCRYVLFEPNFLVSQDIVTSLIARGFPVTLTGAAIWSDMAYKDYHADSSEGQGNTLVAGVHPCICTVQAITLEQALDRDNIARVRFLAINAEQAEYEILKSPAMDRVDYVTVEFHPGKSGIDTKAFVAEHLPQFETLKFGREGDAYNQWLAKNKAA